MAEKKNYGKVRKKLLFSDSLPKQRKSANIRVFEEGILLSKINIFLPWSEMEKEMEYSKKSRTLTIVHGALVEIVPANINAAQFKKLKELLSGFGFALKEE